jgi:hypothetical protein
MANSISHYDSPVLAASEAGLRNLFWGSIIIMLSWVVAAFFWVALQGIPVPTAVGMVWCVWGAVQLTRAHWGTSLETYWLCFAILAIVYIAGFVYLNRAIWLVLWTVPQDSPPALNQFIVRAVWALQLLGVTARLLLYVCLRNFVCYHNLGDDLRRNWQCTLIAAIATIIFEVLCHAIVSAAWAIIAFVVLMAAHVVVIAFYLGSLRATSRRIQDVIDDLERE